MSEYSITNELTNMVPFAAGTATPRAIITGEDGILLAYGTTVPSDTATGYAPGCLFIHVDGSAGTMLYCNEGSKASADFDAVTVA